MLPVGNHAKMNSTMSNRPKIFISYSWSPISNKNWTLDFAERLTRDGIHVIIDEWDAEEGQDKFHFMEQMINNPEVKHVLLICNKDYAEKANRKKGGVGIESQIVSSEIYNNVDQNKFIPIVREYFNNDRACLPTFVSNRFYIDLIETEQFEENYEQLVRRIFGKPKHKRPPIGEEPAYIKEDELTFLKTAHKFRPLKDAIVKGKSNVEGFLTDYFDLFNETLKDFLLEKILDPNNPPVDEIILPKFEQLKSLRDEYIDILITYIKYHQIDNEWLFSILENANNAINYKVGDSYYDFNNHLQLFLNEIFLYTIASLIKYEKFKTINFLLSNHYAAEKEHRELEYRSFCGVFNNYNRIFDQFRNSRLDLKRVSVSSDLIKERASNKYISFEEIHDTDIVLHFSGILIHDDGWFPRLSIFRTLNGNPRLIQKMKSKRYFEKVKSIFGINSKDELFEKIGTINKNIYDGYSRYHYDFRDIFHAFREEEICMVE